jgi:iron complex outermembrane recepter protein
MGTSLTLTRASGFLLTAWASIALAQQKPVAKEALEEVVVTGSLIPQIKMETATPVTVITAEDLQSRGFTSVADALQQSSFSTGAVQGAQFSGGFTQGAKTLSMFGLSPSYVKYLIDGLPLSDYPALYNGTDTFTSIGGIPMALVDHIDILPGGQSSLYGSDAIAGVVNVVLKKKVDSLEVDARYGFTSKGGGVGKTFSIADGLRVGNVSVVAGAQYDDTTPIWGYQRGLTSNYFANGTTPQTAERDYLVYGYFGPNGDGSDAYYFLDPNNCAGVASQFGGSVALRTRVSRGQYCGTTKAGYYTLSNGDKSTQGYVHATLDMNQHVELYSDLLLSNDKTYFSNGAYSFNSTYDSSSSYYYFYDPNIDDYMVMQHIFSPEEVGNLDKTYSSSITNMWRGTVGARGTIVNNWRYDLSAVYNQQKLTEKSFQLLTTPLEAFFAPIFGENYGSPEIGGVYTPDYAAFYHPVTPAQYAGFTGFSVNHSLTENTLFRAQLTNPTLFTLPGGDAGIAVVLEGGRQSWEYLPDSGFANNAFFGYTSGGASFGSRTRSALTTELRLPVVDQLTVNASGRYDAYHVEGGSLHKATYTLGLEYRPTNALLARARFGTAFKAPTLSDQFQGLSGFYTGATDYWQCAVNDYTGANLANCPYGSYIFGETGGNAKLQPITAKVWNAGIVWTPIAHATLDIDYLHWKISNEVAGQSSDLLLKTEASCRLGQLDINSPTCVQALSQVTRDQNDVLLAVYLPKQNVAEESLDALTLTGNYQWHAGVVGDFKAELAYTDMLKHTYQQFAGDAVIDLLRNPYYSYDFKTKLNGSITWDREDLSGTLYFTRSGRSPNNLATLYAEGYSTPGAGTLPPWTVFNLSVRYQASKHVQVSGSVINLFNAMPPTDNTYNGLTSQPYDVFDYNPYGRSFRLEVKYTMGR